MNLNKFGRWSGIVAAVAMLAMVLQGCGGDDSGSGISQDMLDALQADYDQAVADRDAAMAGQATAEAAATAAMAAQATAMDAQTAAEAATAAAEARRDSAVAAEAVATAAAAAAETAKTEAEATAAAAVTAKEAADAAAAAANLDVVAANAAAALAESTRMAAESARDAAETARMAAVAAQMMAEGERDAANTARDAAVAAEAAAVMAQTAAESARNAAVMAQTAAEGERDAANTARDAAITARDAAITARDAAIMERDDALAALSMETTAEAAQRARVDAAAIKSSADDYLVSRGVDVNEDGDFEDPSDVPQVMNTTHTVAMYQGSDPVPGSLAATPATRAPAGVMTLTASRVGDTVTFRATADTNPAAAPDAAVLINFDTDAEDGITSGMQAADLPGGLTKHIYLMTDIESSVLRAFGNNVPAGLGTVGFDAGTQQYRYPVFGDDGTAPSSDTNLITVPDNANVDITPPDAFTPSTAVPEPMVQDGATFYGSYAGVPGMYRCAGGATGCNFELNSEDELQMAGLWQFTTSGDPVAIPDGDYLVYGAWLKRPDSAVGSAVAAAISSGSDPFTATNIADLTGTATYEGSAAGFFAERHVDSDGAVSGTFSATATLNADFAATGTAGTLSGSITDFVRDDGATVDWLVNLGMVTLSNSTDAGGFVAGDTAGSASGANWNGEWGVQLVGDGSDDEQHPTGVVGTFGAQHGSTARLTDEPGTGEAVADQGFVGVIGGFGARK